MNKGTAKGEAAGFKVSSITSLLSVKSTKNSSITLFSYLVKHINEKKPEIISFVTEFKKF